MTKLNPKEAPEGYVAIPSSTNNSCLFCDLKEAMRCRRDLCYACVRKDGHSVIFKRKPTKFARKPREWMAWAVVGYEGYVWKLGKTRGQARNLMVDDEQIIRVKITEVLP